MSEDETHCTIKAINQITHFTKCVNLLQTIVIKATLMYYILITAILIKII